MKLLLDVNVVLDVALNRPPFVVDAALVLSAIDQGRAEGFVAAHTITTAFYIIAKNQGHQAAVTAVAEVLRILDVVPVDRAGLSHALRLGWRDFEDAVQTVSASKIGADFIVTRDLQDFSGSPVPARDPAFVLPLLR
ncbi:PIN domain-containing protein [Longimicrobium sp.]|uniref:PIN domain-containing protein n=1 Tax=Longimicrobium sp. TaxID=2029185 RepID=UPI002E370BD1|nr:PIN domain-containing protein [Longimicrobium sp.]HEX6042405.1 PIN domain-containing protein [Longimicrobium sp.]